MLSRSRSVPVLGSAQAHKESNRGVRMRTTLVTVAISGALVVSACGSSTSGGASNSGGPGTYSTNKDGVTTTIEIPAATKDPIAKAIAEYAAAVGATSPYSFLAQTLKNDGSSEVVMCDPRVVTQEGATVTFKQAFNVIADLRNLASSDTTLYNQGVELENSLPDSKTLPGATTTLLFASAESLPSIKSVTSGYTSRELMGQGCDVQMEKTADAAPAVVETGSVASAAASPNAIVGISPEDLAVGLPTVSELSEAQGSTFVRKANYPMWTQATPLSRQRRDGAEFGNVRETTPRGAQASPTSSEVGYPKDSQTQRLSTVWASCGTQRGTIIWGKRSMNGLSLST